VQVGCMPEQAPCQLWNSDVPVGAAVSVTVVP